jgi:hypothetical protein
MFLNQKKKKEKKEKTQQNYQLVNCTVRAKRELD